MKKRKMSGASGSDRKARKRPEIGKRPLPIPVFATEEEEAEFWDTHSVTDYFDMQSAVAYGESNTEKERAARAGARSARLPTLHVVIANAARRAFICGIFESADTLSTYLREIPDFDQARHRVEVLKLEFPLYVIEDARGLRLLTADSVHNELERFRGPEHVDDDDHCYATLYRVDEEYRPRVAGQDEMGWLNHTHITNSDLDRGSHLGLGLSSIGRQKSR